MPMQDLDSYIEEMHAIAMQKTGLVDFGAPDYLEGLRALLQAYSTDCTIDRMSWDRIVHSMISPLVGRLYAHHGWHENPRATLDPVHRPVVIVGLARTGTTALQRLLALDPQFQYLTPWIGSRPMARPPARSWQNCSEFTEATRSLEDLNSRLPSFKNIHRFDAKEADECGPIFVQAFAYWGWGVILPSYADFLRSTRMIDVYRYYASVLQLIGIHERDKTWLLKDPFHMRELDSLLSIMPTARIIQTHRDPVHAIPSWYSLVKTYHATFDPPLRHPDQLGRRLCEHWRVSLDKECMIRQRASVEVCDIDYGNFVEHPLSVIESIYERFELTLTRGVREQMATSIAKDYSSHRSKHKYDLEWFNITPEEIYTEFADYCAAHKFK